MLSTLLTMSIIAVIGAARIFANSGRYDVGTNSQHRKLVGWLISTTPHTSVQRGAANVAVPDLPEVTNEPTACENKLLVAYCRVLPPIARHNQGRSFTLASHSLLSLRKSLGGKSNRLLWFLLV